MPVSLPTTVPWDLGSEFASLAPRPGAIALAGREFILDLSPDQPYQRDSVPLTRAQFDTTKEPGEQSLGDGWWRRSQSDFSGGAGQRWLDREDSSRSRFYSSKGVDVFGIAPEIQAHKDTARKRTSSNTNLFRLTAGVSTQYDYIADGSELRFTTDPFTGTPTYTDSDIDGGGAWSTIQSICSDGVSVYATDGSNIRKTALGATSSSSFSTQDATLIRWVKGRIMAANVDDIYELSSAGAATAIAVPGALPGTWTWTDFCEIGPAILVSGYSGEHSSIYRINIDSTGLLTTPVEAVEGGLPPGEIVNTIRSYLNYVFIGTNKGVRMAVHDAEGNLTYGPLIPVDTTIDVRCFEPQDKYVWFGWTNYDASSTGLGRIDLRTFTADLRPAYASDLMVSTQGTVLSVSTHSSKRLFAVSGYGFVSELTTYVASGVLQTSKISYGTNFDKIGKDIELNIVPSSGSVTPSIADESGSFTTLAACSETGHCTVTAGSTRASYFSLRLTITPVAGGASTPSLTYWTLRSIPAAGKQRVFTLPILISDRRVGPTGFEDGRPGLGLEDLEFLELLEDDADGVSYVDMTSTPAAQRGFDVVVEQIRFRAYELATDGLAGVAFTTLRKVT